MAILGPAVLVLGMHRSGTSCLAGCLEARGLDLGTVSRSDPHNAKGNREDVAVRELDEAVLAHSGGSWDAPPAAVSWDDGLRARRDALLAARAAGGRRLWGFKDPRLLVTLPFWHAALRQPLLVATFRHPLAVARSLAARNGLALDAGLALWSLYNERLLALRRVRRFPIVRFDIEAELYQREVAALAGQLGLPAAALGDDFRDDALVHQEPLGETVAPHYERQLAELESFRGVS
jgi:hypothetical protein